MEKYIYDNIYCQWSKSWGNINWHMLQCSQSSYVKVNTSKRWSVIPVPIHLICVALISLPTLHLPPTTKTYDNIRDCRTKVPPIVVDHKLISGWQVLTCWITQLHRNGILILALDLSICLGSIYLIHIVYPSLYINSTLIVSLIWI